MLSLLNRLIMNAFCLLKSKTNVARKMYDLLETHEVFGTTEKCGSLPTFTIIIIIILKKIKDGNYDFLRGN